MEGEGIWIIVGALLALYVAWKVLALTMRGATYGFLYASGSGFIGQALYIILWIIGFPLMVVVCFLAGCFLPKLSEN